MEPKRSDPEHRLPAALAPREELEERAERARRLTTWGYSQAAAEMLADDSCLPLDWLDNLMAESIAGRTVALKGKDAPR